MRQDKRHYTHYEADTTEDEERDAAAGYPERFPPVTPKSAIRYRDTTDQSVYSYARRRYEIEPGAPPPVRRASREQPLAPRARKTEEVPPRRRLHPLVFVGMALFIMVVGYVALTSIASWWTNTTQQWQYGYPRTAQYDVAVDHNDSPTKPSHFIALNLNGQVEIIEFPGGDVSRARIYTGIAIVGPNADLNPVTLSFQDVNGDGTLDMIVTVGSSHYVFLNEKGQFVKPQSQ